MRLRLITERRVLVAAFLLPVLGLVGCTLLGFSIGAAVDHGKHDVDIAGWQFEEVKPGTGLQLILKNGTTIKGEYAGRGPTASGSTPGEEAAPKPGIRLAVDGRERNYPVEDVELVRIHPQRLGKMIGAFAGVILDVLVLNSLNQPTHYECNPPSCYGGSCPYAYSYDGEGYTLEGEMFGGAIFQASQRTDRVRFEGLVPHRGEYRIRLANHNQEIQYVDRARLLVVDHAAAAQILPTLGGDLVSLAHPVPPAKAQSLAGANVISLVHEDDGDSWISTPFERDPDDPAQLRDGLVLEFPRPPGAEEVTLGFTVRSTRWAAGLLNHLVGLQGRDVETWRGRMNADSAARIAFLSALRREGLLRLSVWDGQGWRDSGVLANVGPAAPRRQALRVDLHGVETEALRVRLDATPGMWTVDAAFADYSAQLPANVRELDPIRATSHDGRDLQAVLAAVDGRYYTMPTTSDSAELVFAALPPPAPGQHRTFIFEANGYYSILVAPNAPRLALFDELVTTPGAFARYSLGLAAEELARAQARQDASTERRSPGQQERDR